MNDQITNLVVSMAILVVLGLIAFKIFGTAANQRRQRKTPRLGAEVYVVSKRVEEHRAKRVYFVTFRLKDDNVMEFAVPEESYQELKEGDFVKIVFKGELFEGYKRLEKTEEAEENEE